MSQLVLGGNGSSIAGRRWQRGKLLCNKPRPCVAAAVLALPCTSCHSPGLPRTPEGLCGDCCSIADECTSILARGMSFPCGRKGELRRCVWHVAGCCRHCCCHFDCMGLECLTLLEPSHLQCVRAGTHTSHTDTGCSPVCASPQQVSGEPCCVKRRSDAQR